VQVQDVVVNNWTYSRRGAACGEDVYSRRRDMGQVSASDQAQGKDKAAIWKYQAQGSGP
jgi:hypothetical protein